MCGIDEHTRKWVLRTELTITHSHVVTSLTRTHTHEHSEEEKMTRSQDK